MGETLAGPYHAVRPYTPMPRIRPYRIEARATMALALPIVVTQLAHISLGFVDTVMVGRLGPVPDRKSVV